jgi:hypothetical protein
MDKYNFIQQEFNFAGQLEKSASGWQGHLMTESGQLPAPGGEPRNTRKRPPVSSPFAYFAYFAVKIPLSALPNPSGATPK